MKPTYKYDILSNHNDYEVSIPRNKLEEIRNDPFGLGSTVKGLTPMNHERNLSDYAEELVIQYAKYEDEQFSLYFCDLTDEEQNELVRLFLEATDRETSECVYGDDLSINSDYTCALLSMLKNNCPETRNHFAEVTRKNTIIYYKKSLQDLIDIQCYYHLENLNNEAGLYSQQCRNTGEVYWSKF